MISFVVKLRLLPGGENLCFLTTWKYLWNSRGRKRLDNCYYWVLILAPFLEYTLLLFCQWFEQLKLPSNSFLLGSRYCQFSKFQFHLVHRIFETNVLNLSLENSKWQYRTLYIFIKLSRSPVNEMLSILWNHNLIFTIWNLVEWPLWRGIHLRGIFYLGRCRTEGGARG